MSGPPPTADSARPDTGDSGSRDRPSGGSPTLSVVVVARDGDRIGACLDAVFSVCQEAPSFEVVLVDASTGERVGDVASDHGITILDGPAELLATRGAARYVGTQWARGEFLLFVDGDVVLADSGWLTDALDELRTDADLAGVGGYEPTDSGQQTVDALGAVAMYDHDALQSVGGYHPFLAGRADEDLGFELACAGYGLRRLPAVAGRWPSADSKPPRRRWRDGHYRAAGQVCSKALTRPRLLARWLWSFRTQLLGTCWLALGALAVLAQPLAVVGWVLATTLCVGLLCVRFGPRTTFRRICSLALFAAGFVLGFEAIPGRDAFPLESITVRQTGAVQDGQRRAKPTVNEREY